MPKDKKSITCKRCFQIGHFAKTCKVAEEDLPEAPPPPRIVGKPSVSGVPKKPEKKLEFVSARDVPKIREALVGVLTALESVDPEHRKRIWRSAQILLGEEA